MTSDRLGLPSSSLPPRSLVKPTKLPSSNAPLPPGLRCTVVNSSTTKTACPGAWAARSILGSQKKVRALAEGGRKWSFTFKVRALLGRENRE